MENSILIGNVVQVQAYPKTTKTNKPFHSIAYTVDVGEESVSFSELVWTDEEKDARLGLEGEEIIVSLTKSGKYLNVTRDCPGVLKTLDCPTKEKYEEQAKVKTEQVKKAYARKSGVPMKEKIPDKEILEGMQKAYDMTQEFCKDKSNIGETSVGSGNLSHSTVGKYLHKQGIFECFVKLIFNQY